MQHILPSGKQSILISAVTLAAPMLAPKDIVATLGSRTVRVLTSLAATATFATFNYAHRQIRLNGTMAADRRKKAGTLQCKIDSVTNIMQTLEQSIQQYTAKLQELKASSQANPNREGLWHDNHNQYKLALEHKTNSIAQYEQCVQNHSNLLNQRGDKTVPEYLSFEVSEEEKTIPTLLVLARLDD